MDFQDFQPTGYLRIMKIVSNKHYFWMDDIYVNEIRKDIYDIL